MPEPVVPPVVPEIVPVVPPVVPDVPPKTYDEAYVKNLRDEAAKARIEARDTKTEFDKVRQSSMTEAEKAIADAKAAGRAEVSAEYGTRLVRADFTAYAAKFNAEFDASAILDDLNLAKYVTDDGLPDDKAIKAAVARLIPAPESGPPSFDGGARTPAAPAKDMNDLLRRATGRA